MKVGSPTPINENLLELHKSLLKAGVDSHLFKLPVTQHGFDLYKPSWSPATQSATYVTERFLASLCYLRFMRQVRKLLSAIRALLRFTPYGDVGQSWDADVGKIPSVPI
jgi:hypothetical protein